MNEDRLDILLNSLAYDLPEPSEGLIESTIEKAIELEEMLSLADEMEELKK